MAYVYSDESNKHLKVHFECDRMNRCPSSSCYTSSSCSSSSRSSIIEEPYDFDKADFDSSPEANQPDLIEPPAPAPSPEVSPQTTVPQIPMASGRPSGYDPTRLPPAMFAAKPSSAMDWSVASNESLFSIHVGNSSFSKDQYSNELGKLEEMVETLETDRHSVSVDTKSVESRSDISEEENFDINIVTGNVEKDKETEETIRLPTIEETKGSAFSHRSDESNQSFQFPVLASHHDHHDHVKPPLEQVKEKKQEMRAPEKQQYQPGEKSPERNAQSKAAECSSWLFCFCCCWICR